MKDDTRIEIKVTNSHDSEAVQRMVFNREGQWADGQTIPLYLDEDFPYYILIRKGMFDDEPQYIMTWDMNSNPSITTVLFHEMPTYLDRREAEEVDEKTGLFSSKYDKV